VQRQRRVPLPPRTRSRPTRHPWLDLRAFLDLTRRFRALQPDIVHTHSGKAGFVGRLAARRARVPIIVHTIHGPSFGPFQSALANSTFLTAERIAARATTHFVAVADAMVEQYRNAGIGRAGQYSRIYSGFDLEPFLETPPDPALRSQLGLDPHILSSEKSRASSRSRAMMISSPSPQPSSPAAHNARFLLVGDGPWRQRLQSAVDALGLTHHFRFAGLVPPTDVPRYLALMDVLVHLSRREGLPRALPQAMAAARPVVALNLDGAPEVCRDNVTGFLIEPNDSDSLTQRLLQLAGDPDLRLRLGQQGRSFASAHFSTRSMVDALHQLYRQLLDSNFTASRQPIVP
jgi:glycosyltransferase involved in cell wall biosynthesis